jgi:hypothetical protein
MSKQVARPKRSNESKWMRELIDYLMYMVEVNEIFDGFAYYETLRLSKRCGYKLTFSKTENERDIYIHTKKNRVTFVRLIYMNKTHNKYETLYLE